MIIGKAAIIFALVATIISSIYYILAARDMNRPKKSKDKDDSRVFQRFGRFAYVLMTTLVASATVYLFYLFMTHQFQVQYVYQYSSRELPVGLLVSSLWAGQQGSFLLWALLTAVMGIFLMRSSGKFENYAMFFLNIVQLFFLILLIKASPFEIRLPVPPDGAGLNPLLQNFWMIIHPPILFVGYAAIAFPLVLSFAALIQKEYNGWISLAFPWTIISSITLGSGIIIGAFWAYETLGWGGYWGWDPVENSSLIPWLTILALLHGLLVQKRNGALAKTNFFYAIISYILVLYATFLTRSGVLADFSVHSFQNLGINGLLILFMLTIFVIGMALFIPKMKQFPHQSLDFSALNRENALVFSLWVFTASAFLVSIGTSSPIISGLFGEPSQVDISFYDKVNLPIGIIMAFLLGITPYLYWVEKDYKDIPKRMLVPFLLGIVTAAIMVVAGLDDIINIIFFFAAAFALWTSLFILVRNIRVNWLNSAAPLAHFGVSIMLIGIIGSAHFSTSKRVALTQGKSVKVFDYDMTYQGMTEMPDGKSIANIEVIDANLTYIAKPRLFPTRYNDGVMREPDIKAGFLTDLYISPMENRQVGGKTKDVPFLMVKGESKVVGDYQITFTGFNMANHESGGHMVVGADLEVKVDETTTMITPSILMGAEGRQMQPATMPHRASETSHNHPSVFMTNLNADQKQIELVIQGMDEGSTEAPVDQLIVEVSKKPFMSILWIGTVILILGSVVAFVKRIKTDK